TSVATRPSSSLCSARRSFPSSDWPRPMRLEPDEARRRFAAAPVARLATVTPDGRPQIVPITFAVEGDRIYTIVDTVKPKTSLSLARLRNIGADPRVSLLVDEHDEDWERLWWVRADGTARIVAD